jgi:hypothetical protein
MKGGCDRAPREQGLHTSDSAVPSYFAVHEDLQAMAAKMRDSIPVAVDAASTSTNANVIGTVSDSDKAVVQNPQ